MTLFAVRQAQARLYAEKDASDERPLGMLSVRIGGRPQKGGPALRFGFQGGGGSTDAWNWNKPGWASMLTEVLFWATEGSVLLNFDLSDGSESD